MKNPLRIIPPFLEYLGLVFLTAMSIMSLERLFLIFRHRDLLRDEGLNALGDIFLTGWRFDIQISTYIVILPLLVMGITYLIDRSTGTYTNYIRKGLSFFLIVLIALCISDIPYFSFYNARLNQGLLSWNDSFPIVFKLIFTDFRYYPYIVAVLVFSWVTIKANAICFGMFQREKASAKFSTRLLVFLFFLCLAFLGIRGEWDLTLKPFTAESAFISENSFVNQMTVNPVFNFFSSFQKFEIQYTTDEEALGKAKNYLGSSGNDCSPIAREFSGNDDGPKPNIVVILVESLSSSKVGICGSDEALTPNLDSLGRNGLFFPNFYANGVHTHNGIFSTLYALPAIGHNKSMAESYTSSIRYTGLPETLKQKGYTNYFFCSGDRQFDNMGGFLNSHGIDRVFAKEDYDEKDIYSSWGVSDHSLFDYALKSMNEVDRDGKPFFISILTVSSHDGHIPPTVEDFIPRTKNRDNIRYEYADWAIGRFLKKARSQPWFRRTLFVILGDHGHNFDPLYELPLSYFHIPLIIYSPALVEAGTNDRLAMQIDVFPTVMGLADLGYENNTFGQDMTASEREMVYFSSDDYLACLDRDYYLIIRKSGVSSLFTYRQRSLADICNDQPEQVIAMKDYMYSMLQSCQYLMQHDLLGFCSPDLPAH